jgi:hypothetical protein
VAPLGLGAAPAFGGAGADQVALDIGKAAEYRQHHAPGAGAGVGLRLGQWPELCLGVHNALDDAEQIEGAAREAVNPRHHHHNAGRKSRRQRCALTMGNLRISRSKPRCRSFLPANGPIAIEFVLPQRFGGHKITPNGSGIWEYQLTKHQPTFASGLLKGSDDGQSGSRIIGPARGA